MSGLDAELRVERDGFVLDARLVVPAHRVVALMGRNGAGKSTAVAAIAGLLPLDGGRVVVDGEVLEDVASGRVVPPERRPIGVVQQQSALFPHLTVAANVAFGLRTQGRSRSAARAEAHRLLTDAGLADLADRRPSAVSGGQAARVALVRTLARSPRLVLLDEPLAAIDAELRPALRDAIRAQLRAFAGSALLVTHDVRDAEALADEVVVIDRGRVLQQGSLASLRAAPAAPIVSRLLDGATD
ncbi:ABC transporter ATP-binding protein [Amnibacterium kyonggiense]|uniref:ABC transporter family protein n=1 Tax=Amnibacterium kyonggiense TaxID=595671 RepID=A0A4R7FJB4_9MICO|nr:ATP-binding cassette domain-containing protein [Amnibacterium kyonggiense]TDS76116.1 ABC transporter family protein [Amnibacterium kyonggiense]